MSRKRRLWLVGSILAAGGLALGRGISGLVHPPLQLALFLLGTILAFAGLAVIALGLRER